MPVEELKSNLFEVNHLTLSILPDGRRSLLFSCSQSISGLVLCFSKGRPLTGADVDVTDEELLQLLHGAVVKKDGYRLQGVPRARMNGAFTDFQAVPPEQIQVWTLVMRNNTEPVLYIPADPAAQICFAPLLYRVHQRTEGGYCYLTVTMPDTEYYQSGALWYQVDDLRPIPIPRSCIGREICIRTTSNTAIKVIVGREHTGKYKEY